MGKNLKKNNWFTIEKVSNKVWGIAEFKHFEKVISYLIVGEHESLLIDTGLGIQNIKKAVNKITKKPTVVINTHSHFDHIGGNKLFNKIIQQNQKIIKISPYYFKIIKTPGHSPDSICLFEENKSWLFSGDTLYLGPIYLHLKESNLNDYVNSLKKLLKLKILKIFPAHNDFNFPVLTIKKILTMLEKNKLKNKVIIDRKTSLLIK